MTIEVDCAKRSTLTLLLLVAGVATAAAQADNYRTELPKQPHPRCLVWSDGCVRCDSPVDGVGRCTDINVPGTCKPQAVVCTWVGRSKRRS
jgi:hypothetical protein